MPQADLGEHLMRIRERRQPAMSRRELGEAVGYEGDSAYQTVYEWETGRRSIPSELMRDIAVLLGVPICELYGVEEGHEQERASSADWARRLVEQLAQHPERIEINLYKEGGSRGEGVAASGRALADEAYEPPLGLRFMRAFLAEGRWREMPETERDQWRELAEAIRREEGAGNGPGSQVHGRGYP